MRRKGFAVRVFSPEIKLCIFVVMKYHKGLFFLGLAVVLFSSCEEEPPPIRYIEKPLLDTSYMGMVPTPQAKIVWLADITGVKCTNCPEAAEIAHDIYKSYPGRVELIALYPTFFPTLTSAWSGYDTLTTTLANEVIGAEPEGIPRGLVDNINYNGNRFVDRFSWPLVVQNQLQKSSPINLELKCTWNRSEDKGRVEYKAIAHTAFTKPVLLVGALLEDKIIGKQSDRRVVPSGYIGNYQFDHVFRSVIGSTQGDTLARSFAIPGFTVEKHYYISKSPKWKIENMSCLIWILDAETREVLQCKSAKFTF